MQKFALSKIAEAALMPVATLRNWFGTDGPFQLDADDDAAPKGGTRYVTLRTALAVAIAAELNRKKVDPQRAAQAGMAFAYVGSTRSRRAAGELFSGPFGTYVVVPLDDDAAEVQIIAGKAETIMLTIREHEHFQILRLDSIVARMRKALGVES